ncbi:DUF1428 domain-containing protein [Paracoccus suum]|uniref:DUF1428 domain-containing protein n=1 Tax=Paracoccus suum TaxID=2259340 RepID=A0A344PH85_9RHOB|nr:DUF1428 domain-containing protein [Paracoccus suum]AXC48740.1 DUF1428 domain-containing protein [Paracoccus suum]
MTYYTGSVCAVPKANRQAYLDHATAAWPYFQKAGATRMVETWGEDIPPGKQTDFARAVAAKDDETVVFSWIEWPDRATADKAWSQVDPTGMPEMPFDGKRMIFGGFSPLTSEGTDRGAGWLQGFIVPVPTAKRDAYAKVAEDAWGNMFQPKGCLGVVETWAQDVPHGKQTDFYRAIEARDDETVVFSWMTWPDRPTCEAAGKAMEKEMADKPMPDMPFDGARMVYGGFAPLFDSAKN